MPVGEGTDQLCCDLCAPDRGRRDAKGLLQRRNVKAPEMEQLQRLPGRPACRSRFGARVWPFCDLHQMRIARTVGQLHDTQPVPSRVKTHRLGVDGHDGAEGSARQADRILVKMNGHRCCSQVPDTGPGLRIAAPKGQLWPAGTGLAMPSARSSLALWPGWPIPFAIRSALVARPVWLSAGQPVERT